MAAQSWPNPSSAIWLHEQGRADPIGRDVGEPALRVKSGMATPP